MLRSVDQRKRRLFRWGFLQKTSKDGGINITEKDSLSKILLHRSRQGISPTPWAEVAKNRLDH